MKRVEFAALADISPAMVTKYDDAGLIVFTDATRTHVDPAATLAALAGRLDADKHAAALSKLGAPAAPAPRNAKLELDELKRDAHALDLAKRAGDLIPIRDVETAIHDAITELQAAFDIESRAMADQLAIDLGLSVDRAATLQRRLRTLCNRARTRFAASMSDLAGDDAPALVQDEGDAAAEA